MSVFRPVSRLAGVASVLLLPALALAGTSVDRARVIDVEPVYRTVTHSVPVEECRLVDVPVNDRSDGYRSYTAPIVGAIIGGAIGNAVGHNKTNKKVGTVVGAVLGGTIGRDVGRRNAENRGYQRVAYRTEEVCEMGYETREESELDGYDVTYRYAGETHQTRMDRDPGNYLKVRVRVTPV